MPLTPSHIAAVIPLKGRAALPFAALAAGSMSPDLWYYLPGGWVPQPSTHTPWGILVWDLLFGVVMWVAWRAASGPLHDLAPAPIRRRWRLPDDPLGAWAFVPVAVLIGAVSHVLWDEFTHAGRFGTATIAPLAATYVTPFGVVAGYQALQYLSGAFGLAVIGWVGLRVPQHQPEPRRRPRLVRIMPLAALLGGALSVAVRLLSLGASLEGHSLAFIASTAFITGAVVAVAVLCVVHAFLDRARPLPESSGDGGRGVDCASDADAGSYRETSAGMAARRARASR